MAILARIGKIVGLPQPPPELPPHPLQLSVGGTETYPAQKSSSILTTSLKVTDVDRGEVVERVHGFETPRAVEGVGFGAGMGLNTNLDVGEVVQRGDLHDHNLHDTNKVASLGQPSPSSALKISPKPTSENIRRSAKQKDFKKMRAVEDDRMEEDDDDDEDDDEGDQNSAVDVVMADQPAEKRRNGRKKDRVKDGEKSKDSDNDNEKVKVIARPTAEVQKMKKTKRHSVPGSSRQDQAPSAVDIRADPATRKPPISSAKAAKAATASRHTTGGSGTENEKDKKTRLVKNPSKDIAEAKPKETSKSTKEVEKKPKKKKSKNAIDDLFGGLV